MHVFVTNIRARVFLIRSVCREFREIFRRAIFDGEKSGIGIRGEGFALRLNEHGNCLLKKISNLQDAREWII